jgi:DNA polymerase-3 subunit beta
MAKGALAKAAGREVSAIVPSKLMSLIVRIAGGSEQTLSVRIAENNQILIRTAQAVLMSNLVQGNFPKYSEVIPREATRKATVDSGRFLHRIRQAALLTNEESKGVRLSFTGDTLTMTSRAPETGEAEVKTAIAYEGEPMDIGFNPAYLTDALKVVDGGDVVIEMNASNKPGLIRSGSDFLYVLMPVDLG